MEVVFCHLQVSRAKAEIAGSIRALLGIPALAAAAPAAAANNALPSSPAKALIRAHDTAGTQNIPPNVFPTAAGRIPARPDLEPEFARKGWAISPRRATPSIFTPAGGVGGQSGAGASESRPPGSQVPAGLDLPKESVRNAWASPRGDGPRPGAAAFDEWLLGRSASGMDSPVRLRRSSTGDVRSPGRGSRNPSAYRRLNVDDLVLDAPTSGVQLSYKNALPDHNSFLRVCFL